MMSPMFGSVYDPEEINVEGEEQAAEGVASDDATWNKYTVYNTTVYKIATDFSFP